MEESRVTVEQLCDWVRAHGGDPYDVLHDGVRIASHDPTQPTVTFEVLARTIDGQMAFRGDHASTYFVTKPLRSIPGV